MTRGLGWIPDHAWDVQADLRARHIGLLVGNARVSLPEALDHSTLLDRVTDQGATNSCVGHAFATSIYLRAKVSGRAIQRPSSKGIYDYARMVDAPYQHLVDDGCRPRAAIVGMQDHGLVTEETWPLTEANVNVRPPLDVARSAIDAELTGYYRISSGLGCSLMIRQALVRGFFPAFAMLVDASYQSYDGSDVYDRLSGPPSGGHMQCAVGFGPSYILVANSWGTGWGRSGMARIGDSLFDTHVVSDVLVPTVVPLRLA